MPENEMHKSDDASLFQSYLQEVDSSLVSLPVDVRQDIQQELLAHLEDAAIEAGKSADDRGFQAKVIETLGPGFELGIAFYSAHQGGNSMKKRLFDMCFATFWLVIFSPLLLISAFLIKLDSRGPVFYRMQLVGRHGKHYTLYKFRSMYIDAAPEIPYHARITRVGHYLRKYGVDEIPQFWSVLRGDMSIVGPTPVQPHVVNINDPLWKRVLLVRPGMVGPSFAHYGRAHTTHRSMDEIEIDARYSKKQSLLYDLGLIKQVVKRLFN